MLASILQSSGYKTALYTSPHLYDFRERIKINGQMVSENFVVGFVEKIEPLIEKMDVSFFEITVAMAFTYFAEEKVDIAIIEVGLGGRLDSTNIIHPELSVITNISFDHTALLGNTLTAIAGEKGGIIKEKVPVIIGQKSEETTTVFTTIAKQKNATLYFAEDHFKVINFFTTLNEISITVEATENVFTETYTLDLPGIYQTKNLPIVLQAVSILKEIGFIITNDLLKKGLATAKKSTGLLGRWEVLNNKPLIVLEVAHNEDGVQQMLQHINNLSYKTLHLIIGTVKDKDITTLLSLLPQSANYYFTQAHIPRALGAAELKNEAHKYNLVGNTFDDVNAALVAAKKIAAADDLIIVCGSIFLVAEVDRKTFGI
jgi:dihydrofolate synthase/folylpolyglutamate synthase